jgi:sugar lactone lactonase YvrE
MITPAARFAALAALSLTALCAPPTLAAPPRLLAPGEYLPVSALKPGMKGYGLTIFRGTKIERFDVTVLGVLKRVNNGRDLVFVRLGGPNMRRFSDVIAGMSGSPVYVNGRLIGAVAYGAEFTREPVGYVTPIEDMLDAWDPGLPQGEGPGAAPPPVGGLRPLLTPVSVSGVPASRFGRWAGTLEKLGLRATLNPVGGAAAPGTNGKPALPGSALTPGGAVAMSLATGDIDLSAIGTLTYRRGKDIVAFGHPFLGIGSIDAPMFTAYIHEVQPSFAESQKVGSAVSLVGAFSQDRPFSIGGRIGAQPRMIPITVRVADRALHRTRDFHAKLVRHPLLMPQLAPLAAGSAIAQVHGQPGDAMATVKLTVEADEVGTVTRTDRVYDPAAIDEAATRDLTRLMGLLAQNPFGPVGVKRIALDVTIEPGRRTAQLERVFLRQGEYAPGDTVEVGAVLKPYRSSERVTKTLTLRIPPDAPAGTLMLMVQGGGGALGGGGIVLGGSGGITLAPGLTGVGTAANLKQLLKDYTDRERGDALVARLLLPSASVSIDGEKLSGLPPHIEAAMRGGRSSAQRLERDEVKSVALTDYVLAGAQALPVKVVRRNAPTGAGAAPTPSYGAPPSSSEGSGAPIPATPPPGTPSGAGRPLPGEEEPDDEAVAARAVLTGVAPPVVARPPKAGGEEDEAGEDAAPAPTATPPTPAKAVGRLPGVWRQAGAADFRGAVSLKNVAVTARGEVRPAPSLSRVAEGTEPYFWCLAPDGAGGVYAGSGDQGVIYHVAADGKMTEFARTGELEVHALARAADGTLYAATSPHGRVFAIAPDGGKPKLLLDAAEPYALALALSGDGNTLYVGTGGAAGQAKVTAVTVGGAKGEAAEVYRSGDEGSVTALCVAPDGKTVYAGTSPGGLVVRVAGPGVARPSVLFDSADPAVAGLAAGKDGAVYAATAPRGALYRIDAATGAGRRLYERPPGGAALAGVALGPDGTVYTAYGKAVIALPPGATGVTDARAFEAPSDIQILSLLTGADGRLWASTGSVGGVYTLGGGTPETGELVSSVFDAGAPARWGTLRWSASVPAGGGLTLQTRTGDTAEPDATWSDWSAPVVRAAGEKIASPAGRFLQYRATFTGTGSALRTVEAFYRTPNQAPTVAVAAPKPGELWHGKRTVRWAGTDPDQDALRYEVFLSGDGGKTWQKVEGAAVVKATPATAEDKPAPKAGGAAAPKPAPPTVQERQVLGGLKEALDRDPDISPEMRARILRDAPAQVREAVTAPPPSNGANTGDGTTGETALPLDTSRYPDGEYLIRVVASDRAANPDEPLIGEAVSSVFRIANAAPTLTTPAPTVNADRTVRLTGVAAHPSVAVRAVQYRIDNGEWSAALATDGLFDSGREPFTLTTTALPPGAHTLEVQAQDEAGNATTARVTVTVKGS